jgi:hypothetical protein
MTFKEQFDSVQWRTLQYAPFLVLSGVAGRYGNFAVEEVAVFERWLDAAMRAPGSLNREVLSSVAADITELTSEYECYGGTIVSGLTSVSDVLVHQPPPEIEAFRSALIHVLGAGVGRARGPYGKELTTECSQMLVMMEEFLRPGIFFAPETAAG